MIRLFEITTDGECLLPMVAHKLYEFMLSRTTGAGYDYTIDVYTSLFGDLLLITHGEDGVHGPDDIMSWLEIFMVELVEKEALMRESTIYKIRRLAENPKVPSALRYHALHRYRP